jgi:hypothetical protein
MKMLTPKLIRDHTLREFKIAGMLDESADAQTKNIVKVLTEMLDSLQGLDNPDGKIMDAAIGLFVMSVKMRLFSPVTDSPEEWDNKSDLEKGYALWQNNRDPNLFSEDEGKTYHVLDDVKNKRESKKVKKQILITL